MINVKFLHIIYKDTFKVNYDYLCYAIFKCF